MNMFEKFQNIAIKNFSFGPRASTVAAAFLLAGVACTSRKYTIPFTDRLGGPAPNQGILVGEVRDIENDAKGLSGFDLYMGDLTLEVHLKTQEERIRWKGVQLGDHFKVQYKFDPNTNQLDFIVPSGVKDKIKETERGWNPEKIGIKQGYG